MKTFLNYNASDLIKRLIEKEDSYQIVDFKDSLKIIKKRRWGKDAPIILPKQIKISPEVVGLIVGEGFIGERHFVFANSNERVIKTVKEFLIQLGLPIRNYLEISIKNQSKNFIKECKDFWEKNENIKIERIRLRKEFNNTTEHGTIHLALYNTLVSKLLKHIIELSKKKIEKNKKLSIGYLRGILAAEGNINVKKKTKCVYMVRISASKKEEREHYKKCLERIGMKIYCKDMPTVTKEESKIKKWKTAKGRAGAVIISRWENFIKILELNLLELHKDKDKKFRKYILNNKFTTLFLSMDGLQKKRFTMKEFQTYTRLSGRSVGRLLTLCKKGYIGRRLIKNKYIYTLNKKYFDLLNRLTSSPFFQSST
ncbi:MAG: hypothetical protein CMH63_02810 [Nanoarchaeota archaeon]|jgi:hypothetical protein|nr:hypothetical protein [Nanoarchaeota archaeon]|tara:strand:- start:9923 stop:11029 length:1107 start_codon:yes stop_codon:yes gene_type:complete